MDPRSSRSSAPGPPASSRRASSRACSWGRATPGPAAPIDKLFLLWGTIGFLAGAGIGFAYVCPIAALVKWFPEHKGLVSGLAVAGFGFGAFLFKGRTFGALGFIEEHGIRDVLRGPRGHLLRRRLTGAMLLRNPPTAAPAPAGSVSRPESGWQDTLRRPAFAVLWLMFFSGAMAGLMVIGIIKVFAGEQLVAAATENGGVLADDARAGCSRRAPRRSGGSRSSTPSGASSGGFVSDMIGRTIAFVAMFVAQAIMMFMLGAMQTELSLAVAASVVGFNFGGNFALFPSATADLFGSKNLGANYGWVFTSYGIAGSRPRSGAGPCGRRRGGWRRRARRPRSSGSATATPMLTRPCIRIDGARRRPRTS
jgi:OFA family oxalate/formate antiporter-like MFS transporter